MITESEMRAIFGGPRRTWPLIYGDSKWLTRIYHGPDGYTVAYRYSEVGWPGYHERIVRDADRAVMYDGPGPLDRPERHRDWLALPEVEREVIRERAYAAQPCGGRCDTCRQHHEADVAEWERRQRDRFHPSPDLDPHMEWAEEFVRQLLSS